MILIPKHPGSIELASSGNYSLLVKGRGDMIFRIDGNRYGIHLDQYDWTIVETCFLNSGRHEIEISGLPDKEACLDVISILRTDRDFTSWDRLFACDPPATVLDLREIDPTKYALELDVNKPFMLGFSNAYDPAWTASVNGQIIKSVRVSGATNGFWIKAVGRVDVVIEFQPQKWFYVGSIISSASLILCAAAFSYSWWRRKRSNTAIAP